MHSSASAWSHGFGFSVERFFDMIISSIGCRPMCPLVSSPSYFDTNVLSDNPGRERESEREGERKRERE